MQRLPDNWSTAFKSRYYVCSIVKKYSDGMVKNDPTWIVKMETSLALRQTAFIDVVPFV